MIARVFVMGAVLLTALLLQTVVFSGLTLFGWRPDVVLVTVVAFALADGPRTGLRYGFAAGLASDVLSGTGLVGMGALVFLLVGYACGLVRPYLAGTILTGQVAVAAAAGAVAVLGYGGLGLLLDLSAYSAGSVLLGALVIGAYDGLIAPFVCRPVRMLSERFDGAAAGP